MMTTPSHISGMVITGIVQINLDNDTVSSFIEDNFYYIVCVRSNVNSLDDQVKYQ